MQLPDGTALPFTELAETAATVAPLTDVTLRDPSEWSLVGKPMERLDILGKSTGTLDYGIDISLEGMVHAAIRLNPRKGGALIGHDATEARGMRGAGCRRGHRRRRGHCRQYMARVPGARCDHLRLGPRPLPPEQEDHWQVLGDSFPTSTLTASGETMAM